MEPARSTRVSPCSTTRVSKLQVARYKMDDWWNLPSSDQGVWEEHTCVSLQHVAGVSVSQGRTCAQGGGSQYPHPFQATKEWNQRAHVCGLGEGGEGLLSRATWRWNHGKIRGCLPPNRARASKKECQRNNHTLQVYCLRQNGATAGDWVRHHMASGQVQPV